MIPAEIAELLAAGSPIYIATRSGDLEPSGTRVWAATVDSDGVHVTAYVHAKGAPAILRDLEAHPEVALTFGRVIDHRTAQIKGAFVGARPATDEERAEVERQTAGFLASLEVIGISRAATEHWAAWPCVALRIRAAEIFSQTPGPGAGEPLP